MRRPIISWSVMLTNTLTVQANKKPSHLLLHQVRQSSAAGKLKNRHHQQQLHRLSSSSCDKSKHHNKNNTTTMSSSNNENTKTFSKRILFLRHGQAQHNPRAEEAKANGCTHETFLELMRQDDAFDAQLTELGSRQARKAGVTYSEKLKGVDLVVSSPLSRAIQTADLAFAPDMGSTTSTTTLTTESTPRICVEHFREINGWLLNAKRRHQSELTQLFPHWDFHSKFGLLSADDETWTKDSLELETDCAERGYQGLLWLMSQSSIENREKDRILVVTHGGILRFMMIHHPNVIVKDGREGEGNRFHNCELREYDMTWTISCDNDSDDGAEEEDISDPYSFLGRPIVTLTEIP